MVLGETDLPEPLRSKCLACPHVAESHVLFVLADHRDELIRGGVALIAKIVSNR